MKLLFILDIITQYMITNVFFFIFMLYFVDIFFLQSVLFKKTV